MSRVKLCFLGNCQGPALSSLAAHLGVDAEILFLRPNFDMDDRHYDEVIGVFRQSDYIFHQRVDANYKIEFVRGDWIKASFAEKAISWPNIYFDGYFPGVRYVYRDDGSKVDGPVGDYHFPEIIYGWKNARPAEEVVAFLENGVALGAFESVAHPVENSLAQLRRRERGLDCGISDFIQERFRADRLFYSMNHPVDGVLFVMLNRLLEKAGLKQVKETNLDAYPYTLDQVILPYSGSFKNLYRPSWQSEKHVKTFAVEQNGSRFATDLSWIEIVEKFYDLYDNLDSRWE